VGLREYIIRRIILVVPVVLGAILLVFAITQLIPVGSRAMLYVKSEKDLKNIDLIIATHHLNQSTLNQFVDWFLELLHGNLGWTMTGHGQVVTVMFARWPGTIEIVILAAPIIIFLGVYLGVLSAVHRDKPADHITRLFSISGYSLPSFWLGLVLLAITYGLTGQAVLGRIDNSFLDVVKNSYLWHRYTGLYTIDGILNWRFDVVLDALKHLILPVTVIVIINSAGLIRIMRSSMLEALTKGYIITARAKGLKNSQVINKHARRNALIPVVTISGLMVAGLLGGLLITEQVFAFEGIGSWIAQATVRLDIAAVIGFTLFTGLIFVISNLLVDILYAYIDPRIRLG
jgi:peptide/nickel transport system permease protein